MTSATEARGVVAPPAVLGVSPRRRRLGLLAGDRWTLATRTLPPLVLLGLGLAQILQLRPMWYDEEYTQLAAGVPLGTLLDGILLRQGVVSYLMDVPPSFNGPYYVLVRVWVAVAGDSATSLRLASLVGAAAAVGVLAELTRRIAGGASARWTGLLAGLLLAGNPLMVEETTQARSYGWALLALALAALWLHEWTTRGIRRWPAVVAAGIAALLHWFTLPVLVGLALYAATSRLPRSGWRPAVALLVATTPALVLVAWSFAGGAAGAPHPIAVGVTLPEVALLDWSGQQTWLAVGLGAAAVAGLVVRRTRRLLVCWAVLPLVLITAVEVLRPIYFPRYLLFTLVAVSIAAAVAFGAIPSRRWAGVLAAALVATTLVATIPVYSLGAREPSPEVIAYLADHQTAGEPIIPADGRTSLDLMTSLDLAPRLEADLALPPLLFTDQTTSATVWLVRVVLKAGSLPVVPAEQRLIDAGWTLQESSTMTGSTTDLRVERWTR